MLLMHDVNTNLIKSLIIYAKSVMFNDIKFVWNLEEKYFYPESGSYESLSNFEIKSFTFREFSKLIGRKKVTLCFAECESEVRQKFDGCINQHIKTLAWETNSYVDYSNTITFLASKNVIHVRKSTSQMATDLRCFSLDGVEWWEVDILGTYFGKEISKMILELYSQVSKL
jgi:hypothetical protein